MYSSTCVLETESEDESAKVHAFSKQNPRTNDKRDARETLQTQETLCVTCRIRVLCFFRLSYLEYL